MKKDGEKENYLIWRNQPLRIYGKKHQQSLIYVTFTLILLASTTHLRWAEATEEWIPVGDTVTGAYGEAVVGTGNAIYIARKTSFYRYTPENEAWITLMAPQNPDLGDTFKTGTALTWDYHEYIYALYGAATSDSRRWFSRYHIPTGTWETLANTTADQGEGDAIAWVQSENKAYATVGGEQRPTLLISYNPLLNTWSNDPKDPPDGMGDGASLIWTGNNLLYALRGEDTEENPLNDFWSYNITSDTWTDLTPIPADPHSGGSGGVGDGGSLLYLGYWIQEQADCIYALSGNQATPENPSIPDNRTYKYTISTDTWIGLTDLPFGIGHYVGCRIGYADGYIYAWQGAPSTWPEGGDNLAKYYIIPEFSLTTLLALVATSAIMVAIKTKKRRNKA